MQVRAAFVVLLLCVLESRATPVSVVRIPRVYNVLIRSDGALAPSEAVTADHHQSNNDEMAANDPVVENKEDEQEEEQKDSKKYPRPQDLPVLDAKMGAIQEGVNYTEVPLSRAYPLTRYTAPLLAPLSYLTPLHGGLILGPVPRLHQPISQPLHYEQQMQPQPHPQQEAPRGLSLPRGAFEDPDRDSVAVEAEEQKEEEEESP